MKPLLKTGCWISLLTGMLAFSACEKKGPMEKAGEELDEAGDKIEESVEDAKK